MAAHLIRTSWIGDGIQGRVVADGAPKVLGRWSPSQSAATYRQRWSREDPCNRPQAFAVHETPPDLRSLLGRRKLLGTHGH